MKKINIIWILALILLIPEVHSLGAEKYYSDNPLNYTLMQFFNTSDGTDIPDATTGQAFTESGNDWVIQQETATFPYVDQDEHLCTNVYFGQTAASNMTMDLYANFSYAIEDNILIYYYDGVNCGGNYAFLLKMLSATQFTKIDAGGAVTVNLNNNIELGKNYSMRLVVFSDRTYNFSMYEVYDSGSDIEIKQTITNFTGTWAGAAGSLLKSIRLYHTREVGDGGVTSIDEVVIWNWTDPDDAYTRPAKEEEPGADTFTVTAIDDYDNSSLTFFNVTFTNSTDSFIVVTLNGSLPIDNATTGLYNITIASNESGGYFNRTYHEYNVSDDLEAELAQSFISINATDLVSNEPLSSFTIDDNYSSYVGTDGYILLPTKEGTHSFNITFAEYPVVEYSYTIGALENITFLANVSPNFNFYLRRESDNTLFDIAAQNQTKLTIFCPEKNIEIIFRNQTYNSTNENITVDCPYTLMKMDVNYQGTTYFRTLIPETTEKNITWYLLDLQVDTAVQKILELIDLTGDWQYGVLRASRGISGDIVDIIEQDFDVATAVTLYLLKDAIYTITLINNDGSAERQLGSLIADSASTVTITYPNIEFYPEETYLQDNITWSYYHNVSTGVLRLSYVDPTQSTTSVTWDIYNGTNSSDLLQSFSSTSSSVTFTYNDVEANNSYYTNFKAINSLISQNISQQKVFSDYDKSVGGLPGFTASQQEDIYHYASGMFLIVVGLLFSAKHAGIGLALVFILAWIFKVMGWLIISNIVIFFLGIIMILGWLFESLRRN